MAAQVLGCWFGDVPGASQSMDERVRKWFAPDSGFDEQLAERFGSLPDRVARGEFAAWRTQPRSALASVLVLDQFPRNLFRGQPRAFAYDPLALKACRDALDKGFDLRLEPIEAVFMYMPLEHAEDPESQERCVSLFESLSGRAPLEMKEHFSRFTDYARRHQEVIRRFGRFPHRNEVLGRESTPEESAYLASGGDTFG